MTEETLENSDPDSLTFVASARIEKHQAKQHQKNLLHKTHSVVLWSKFYCGLFFVSIDVNDIIILSLN